MVLLILVQRGKGGGLTGALGGPGGQSAFGTKAGDLFTRITIVAAGCWIFLLAFCVWWYTESGFSSALADNDVIGKSPSVGAPANAPSSPMNEPGMIAPPTGTGEAATSAASSASSTVTVPPEDAAKPTAEVGPGDLPAKTTEKTEPEAAKNPDPAATKDPVDPKPATEATDPKSDPSTVPKPEK